MTVPKPANKAPIPILTYHQIADAPPKGAPYRSLYVAPQDFARQMAFLALLGYRGLSMGDLQPYLRGERHGKVVGITFDDGYVNNLTHALPVLQRHGFTSTCYAVSQLLGKTNAWDIPAGIAQVPLMTAAQLQQWVAGGQQVGAHTRNHVHLPDVSAEQCLQEIVLSRRELEVGAASPVAHFCYPYGDFNTDTVAAVGNAGFESATTTRRGRCQAGESMLELPRVPVVRSTTRLMFWLKIATRYEDRRRV
ncbi:MAG: polysaccharide deacetylase [Burkholderiales bacterium PBB3]|nr:MAG: polysaccharide deacetylase [Burkholderiales bacterium PBB3]